MHVIRLAPTVEWWWGFRWRAKRGWEKGDKTDSVILVVTLHVGLAPLQKCVGDFLWCKFWRNLPGVFLEVFYEHFFPQKWGKWSGDDICEKSGGPRINIREKSILPKTSPKEYPGFWECNSPEFGVSWCDLGWWCLIILRKNPAAQN